MSLGSAIKTIIKKDEENQEQQAEIQKTKENRAVESELKKVRTLVDNLKKNILDIASGVTTPKVLNHQIKILDTKNKSIDYNYNSQKDIEFFAHFDEIATKKRKTRSEKDMAVAKGIIEIMSEFKQWLEENEINDIQIVDEHDGMGYKSWNSFWVSA